MDRYRYNGIDIVAELRIESEKPGQVAPEFNSELNGAMVLDSVKKTSSSRARIVPHQRGDTGDGQSVNAESIGHRYEDLRGERGGVDTASTSMAPMALRWFQERIAPRADRWRDEMEKIVAKTSDDSMHGGETKKGARPTWIAPLS